MVSTQAKVSKGEQMNRTRWLIVGLLVLLALAVPSLVEACENPPPTCPEGEVMVGTPVWDIVGSHQGECEDDVWTDGIPAVTHEECDTPAIEGHCSVVVSGWFGDSYDMSYAYHRNGNSRNCSMNNEYKHSPDIRRYYPYPRTTYRKTWVVGTPASGCQIITDVEAMDGYWTEGTCETINDYDWTGYMCVIPKPEGEQCGRCSNVFEGYVEWFDRDGGCDGDWYNERVEYLGDERCVVPTEEPTVEPTPDPTIIPTLEPTPEPTVEPTPEPTLEPTIVPTLEPTPEPTLEPTLEPTIIPTLEPTPEPTLEPTPEPTLVPTLEPTVEPTLEPIIVPIPKCVWTGRYIYTYVGTYDGGYGYCTLVSTDNDPLRFSNPAYVKSLCDDCRVWEDAEFGYVKTKEIKCFGVIEESNSYKPSCTSSACP